MRILFIGDVVGRTGRDAVTRHLPELRKNLRIDTVIINGENAAHGFGIKPEVCKGFYEAGADCVTLGNHSWDQKEIIPYIDGDPRLVRPLNYPKGTPGRGHTVLDVGGRKILIVNIMGNLFMKEGLDCPFAVMNEFIKGYTLGKSVQAIFVDFHGEASSEKMAFGHAFDGRISATVGTHTHIPTADAQILPGGTAYQTDAGMTGDYDSVIGMKKEDPVQRFLRKMPTDRLSPAEGEATLCGCVIETDDKTGLAVSIDPVRVGGRLKAT